jgi:uncharacterized membrane protein YhdT
MHAIAAQVVVLVAWTVLALLVAEAARWRGRNFAGWFFLSLLLSPLLSVLTLFILRDLRQEVSLDVATIEPRSQRRMLDTSTATGEFRVLALISLGLIACLMMLPLLLFLLPR